MDIKNLSERKNIILNTQPYIKLSSIMILKEKADHLHLTFLIKIIQILNNSMNKVLDLKVQGLPSLDSILDLTNLK